MNKWVDFSLGVTDTPSAAPKPPLPHRPEMDWWGFCLGARMNRTILFADDANVYHGARRAFFSDADPRTSGGYDPSKMASLIVNRTAPYLAARELSEVRVYTGRPDPTRNPTGAAEHDRKAQAWSQAGAIVIARPLRYLNGKAQQKGVDVAMAIDIVTMAIDGKYDVGLVASTDTDLKPALEYVIKACPKAHVEVIGWRAASYQQRLYIAGVKLWCHWLERGDYDAVADPRDYRT